MRLRFVFAAVCCLVLGYHTLHAQEELPDLDSLDPDTFDITIDLMIYHSTGWFPRPYPGFALVARFEGMDIIDRARSIRSAAFVPTTSPFSHSDPYGDNDERDIKKAFSDEEEDGNPVTGLSGYSLLFTLNLPFPMVLRADAGILFADGLLFSSDRTRSFLDDNGARRAFHEVSGFFLEEYLLKGSIGVQIPLYGAFIDAEDGKLASYYYVLGEYTALYSVDRTATQYAQIADAKDKLRYNNGMDTVVVRSMTDVPALNLFRPVATIGAGWSFNAQFFAFNFEIYAALPTKPVLKDADWKQYMVGGRLGLGYHW